MQDDKYTIKNGLLNVGDGHKLYFQLWGNPEADLVVHLHGGPGGGTNESVKLFFDPKKHCVLFFDQRGSGQSLPLGKREHNTTEDLVNDISYLCEHLGYSDRKISLMGSSWGSCLALVYAIRHPERVDKMLLSGIYTGTKKENDYIQQGGLKNYFPESWSQYISIVPENERHDTVSYYYQKMQDQDIAVRNDHIKRWLNNESIACILDADMQRVIRSSSEIDDASANVAILEAYYFINNCFLPENYIVDNAEKLSNIPMVFVQGRHDHVCPPDTAFTLAEKIGDNCHLQIVPGSHTRSEATVREVLRAYAWSFL